MLATALSGATLTGITAELVGVLPIVLPVAITMLALRKGIGFMFSVLPGV